MVKNSANVQTTEHLKMTLEKIEELVEQSEKTAQQLEHALAIFSRIKDAEVILSPSLRLRPLNCS